MQEAVYIVIVIGVIVGLLARVAYGAYPLYTKDGSPVMVDQVAEERRKALASQQIHAAVSPHVRASGLSTDRRTLIRAVSLGDKRRPQ